MLRSPSIVEVVVNHDQGAFAPRLLEPATFRYTVKPIWVRRILCEGAAVPWRESFEANRIAFTALLPLLRHRALQANDAPLFEMTLASRLERSFKNARTRTFVTDARALADGTALAIRKRNVRLKTDNYLTSRFLPPHAAEVDSALGTTLKAIETSLQVHQSDKAKATVCALLGSQAILTIHPFADGNGRTARMFFASQLLRYQVFVPNVLLGMILMYRGGAHQYHQASWQLRAGHAGPMVTLFADSVKFASAVFTDAISRTGSPEKFLRHCWQELRAIR